MKKLIAIFAVLASLSLAVSPVATAQTNVDIDAVADSVSNADVDTLLNDLQTPPDDDQLPDGFSDAEYANPDTATSEQGVIPSADIGDATGSIAYTMEWEPSAMASPETGMAGTPAAANGGFAIRQATLNYIFVDEEITSDDLDDFKSGAEQGLMSQASPESGTETNIETIQVEGTDAILLTYTLNDQGIQSVVKMVALPVGNTMVISMLVEASNEVNQDAVETSAQDLVLSGTGYLGDVAENGQ